MRLTTWIIYSSVDKSTPFYVYTSKKATYYKLVIHINWKSWLYWLIQNIDSEDWLEKLGKSSDKWLMRS